MEIKYMGVFCAASDRLDAAYYAMAREFGRWLGGRGLTLVYGGADSGLMECVAEGVKAVGGRVVGVVPRMREPIGGRGGTVQRPERPQGYHAGAQRRAGRPARWHRHVGRGVHRHGRPQHRLSPQADGAFRP